METPVERGACDRQTAFEPLMDAAIAMPGIDWLASRMRAAGPASGDDEVARVCAQCRTGANESAVSLFE